VTGDGGGHEGSREEVTQLTAEIEELDLRKKKKKKKRLSFQKQVRVILLIFRLK
jgi:hypothetical protein